MKTITIRSMLLLSLMLLIMVPMILPASACAVKSTIVTGQATASNVQFTYLKSTGNPIVARITSTLTFTGDFQGTGPAISIAIIDTSTGKLTFIEQVTFIGTIGNSQPGTVNILIIGNGIIGGASQARDFLSHGAGGLEGINGVGNQATAAGSDTTTFTVKISFDKR